MAFAERPATPRAESGVREAQPHGRFARDYSIDALRGFAILVVLALHTTPLTYSPHAGPRLSLVQLVVTMAQVGFYQYFCRLAVPVFFIISLFLLLRSTRPRSEVARRRLVRIGGALVFWSAVYWAFGWPDGVPLAGNPFECLLNSYRNGSLYFLVNLLALSLVALGCCGPLVPVGRARSTISWTLLLSSAALLGYLQTTRTPLPFWHLLNFVPYVFAAAILLEPSRLAPWLTLVLASVAVAFEAWPILSDRLPWSDLYLYGYCRPSVVLLALFVADSVFACRRLDWPGWASWLGTYSLGIYAMHPLLVGPFLGVLGVHTFHVAHGVFTLRVAVFAVVSALAISIVYLLGRTPLCRWVR